MSDGEISVVTAEVRRCADAMDVAAIEASASRVAVAAAIAGDTAAWQKAARPGFAEFVDVLEGQAKRIRAELTGLSDKLRAAAAAYDRQDAEGGAALNDSMR